MNKNINLFLGANLKEGFVSYFDTAHQLEKGFFTYIIKGGPGTGKSGMMKKIADHFENKGFTTVKIPCSSDPDSLDGLIIPSLKVSFLDGTAPHTVDPVYPACRDCIVNLGDFWDTEKILPFDEKIIEVCDQNKALLKKAARYISAASEMTADTFRNSFAAIDTAKLSRFSSRFVARKLPEISKESGKEYNALLSAITPKGVVEFKETLPTLADFILSFEDNFGTAGRMFLESVKQSALSLGYDVIAFYSPLHPKLKIEHLVILQAKIAISTHTSKTFISFDNIQRVHAERFYNKKLLASKKERIAFNERASNELVTEAISILKSAKEAHDRLEEYYIDAMDFEGINALTNSLIQRVEERIPD